MSEGVLEEGSRKTLNSLSSPKGSAFKLGGIVKEVAQDGLVVKPFGILNNYEQG